MGWLFVVRGTATATLGVALGCCSGVIAHLRGWGVTFTTAGPRGTGRGGLPASCSNPGTGNRSAMRSLNHNNSYFPLFLELTSHNLNCFLNPYKIASPFIKYARVDTSLTALCRTVYFFVLCLFFV